MPTYDQRPWRRKGDNPFTPIVELPQRHYYPDTLEDLMQIVQTAEAMPDRPAVRACGSHWALSTALDKAVREVAARNSSRLIQGLFRQQDAHKGDGPNDDR